MILSEGFKWKFKKESAGLAEPWHIKGGTLLRVPYDPLGQILEYPEITLAEPILGYRQIRQTWKIRQSAILTRETIFKFYKNS